MLLLLALPLAFCFNVPSSGWKTLDGKPSRLIGHRGERAFNIPEHTLGSYQMGVWEHADFGEPDLVLTKDGVPVCYHDLALKSNTDVSKHPELAHLKRNITVPDVDGSGGRLVLTNDWLVSDLTLAQLKTLKLHVNPRGNSDTNMRMSYFDGIFNIPTFQEYLDLVADLSKRSSQNVGIIPEIKHPNWHDLHFQSRFGPHYFEDTVLDILEANGYPKYGGNPDKGPVIIQSFEAKAAKYIRSKSDVYLVQLIKSNLHMLTPKGLDQVATYANATGAYKEFYTVGAEAVIKYEFTTPELVYDPEQIKKLGGFIHPRDLSKETHARKLEQTPYTFYSSFEPALYNCDTPTGCPETQDRRKELFYFFSLGIDSLFVENIAEAVSIRQQYADKVTVGSLDRDGVVSYVRKTADIVKRQSSMESDRLELSQAYIASKTNHRN